MKYSMNILLSVMVGCAMLFSGLAMSQTPETPSAETDGARDAASADTAAENRKNDTADMPPVPFSEDRSAALPRMTADSYQFNESGPLISLERAQQLARKNNPSFRNLDEQIYQSEVLIKSAWAMLLPTVSATAQLIRNRSESSMAFPAFASPAFKQWVNDDTGSVPFPMGDEIVIQKKWQSSIGLTTNVTLFNARSIPLIQNAYDMVDQQRLKAQTARNDLLFAVTSAYYQIANLRELVNVYADNITVAKESLRMAEARKLVGQGTQIDVMRAQIQLKEMEQTLADAVDAYNTAKRSLALFIGVKGDFQLVMPRQIQDVEQTEASLTDSALSNRVELRSAEMDVVLARRMGEETRNKWIPKFDATFKVDLSNVEGFSGEKANWMLIFGMNWSIFEGGARLAERDERASKIRMAQNQIDQLKLDIKTDVANKVQDKISKQRKLEVSGELVALAEENHKMISKQYEVGMANSLELTDAANELANKKVMRVVAKLEYELALLTLGKTVGEYSSLALK
jgi:outer membrane protein, multidrug efflux system